jgi:hypothetical protein
MSFDEHHRKCRIGKGNRSAFEHLCCVDSEEPTKTVSWTHSRAVPVNCRPFVQAKHEGGGATLRRSWHEKET